MKPQLALGKNSVSAHCPECRAITSFEEKGATAVVNPHSHKGERFNRTVYVFGLCARCGRGALAIIHDSGNNQSAVLGTFFPFSVDAAQLPTAVPADIQAEFREAEQCASFGANRAASALFRSVLEKSLKANGYTKSNDPTLRDLQKRIDAAAADGVITDARRKKAHDDIRSLGNDVLHDDWREVTDDEVEASHRYTQRILEDLYDDRPTVEALLISKTRLPVI